MCREPIVRESHDAVDGSALVADLCVHHMWQPQCNVLFDTRVVDTDALSYNWLSPHSVLDSAAENQTCHDHRADFTPLCMYITAWMPCWELRLNSSW